MGYNRIHVGGGGGGGSGYQFGGLRGLGDIETNYQIPNAIFLRTGKQLELPLKRSYTRAHSWRGICRD